MSYDVSLMIDTGAPELTQVVEIGNYTYNCSRMLVKAIGKSLSDFNGCSASRTSEELRRAVSTMLDNRDEYKAMNPENGWGDFESWVVFLSNIATQCQLHPNTTVRVS